jgi:hypothetical protein
VVADMWRRNIDLFHDAYSAQLVDFITCARAPGPPRRSPARTPGPLSPSRWERSVRPRPDARATGPACALTS